MTKARCKTARFSFINPGIWTRFSRQSVLSLQQRCSASGTALLPALGPIQDNPFRTPAAQHHSGGYSLPLSFYQGTSVWKKCPEYSWYRKDILLQSRTWCDHQNELHRPANRETNPKPGAVWQDGNNPTVHPQGGSSWASGLATAHTGETIWDHRC